MQFAIALTITRQESGRLAMAAVVGVYTARSEEEALGYCIRKIKEERPDYSIASTAVMKIVPSTKRQKRKRG
jgi:hypothetical protein